mmetsp:Transcript_13922/g.20722  ORF Transcript_13922/g.20722 Transcript_13922/m.20722 type:complete len:459 (+) Transcript_13922:109-1485(+)
MKENMRRRRSSTDAMDNDGTIELASSAFDKSASNMTDESNNSTSPQRKNKYITRFYLVHLALVAGVLILGMIHNVGNKKYIPVNAKELVKLKQSQSSSIDPDDIIRKQQCKKAYVNVHSSSINEEFAAVCCHDDENDTTMHSICHPKLIGLPTRHLPFAKRLTRLTEAWVLPLLPIFIRLAYQVICALLACYKRYYNNNQRPTSMQREATSFSYSASSSMSPASSTTSLQKIVIGDSSRLDEVMTPESSHKSIQTTILRLFFYFALLNFRGFGLYIGANALEDYVFLPWFTGNTVTSPLRMNSLSDVEHDIHYKEDYQRHCWYEDALKSHHKSSMEPHSECYGRPFDFSDHVVLFLAHYLPIFFMEMLVCYRFPFWERTSVFWYAIHAFLFMYLHLLVLHSTYQTAVYYHTQGEIIVGYVVSLFVQLPVCYLMCSEKWTWLKRIIGIRDASVTEEKSD